MEFWITRDKSGELYLYDAYPKKLSNLFDCHFGDTSMMLDESQFPEITWENSPQEVELKLVNEL